MPSHQILDPNEPSQVSPKRCALGIMTKAPEAGKVKTRLTPPLTPKEAAQLNICFLRDLSLSILQACDQSPAHGVGIFTPPDAEDVYENILPVGFFLIPQRGESFGERLLFAAEDLFSVGFESVCLINSDSPTVPASAFAETAIELANPGERIVLGPSEDGGYYLIGLKKLYCRIFEEIEWSTERVFAQTKRRAVEIGLPVHELERGLDVDDRATLGKLCDKLFANDADSTVALATRKFLSELFEREGRDRIWPK